MKSRTQILQIINTLEDKFKTIDNKITLLLNDCREANRLLTKIDFITKLGISVSEYDLLQDYNDIIELKEEDIKRLIALNEALEKKYKYIDLVNEKIILSCTDWKVVNRNTITYILNKGKNKDSKQNVIINVYVDDDPNKSKVDLESIGVNNE